MRLQRLIVRALAACLVVASTSSSAAQPAAPAAATEAPRARIAIDETLAAPAALLTGPRPAGSVPLAARLSVTLDALRDAATIDAIDARATALLARDVSLWLAVESPTPAAADLDAWAASVNALVTRLRTRLAWLEIAFTSAGEPRLAAFALKRASVDLHSAAPAARLLAGGLPVGDAAWLDRVYGEDVASYLDGLAAAVQDGRQGRARCRREARSRSQRCLERHADRRMAGRRRLRAGSPGRRYCAGILPGRARCTCAAAWPRSQVSAT